MDIAALTITHAQAPPLRDASPLGKLRIPQPVTERGSAYGAVTAMRQPAANLHAGFLLPYGQFYSPERIQQVADVMGVEVADAPFPGAVLFTPPSGQAIKGALMLLHGSEGGAAGYLQMEAADYASKGYVSLAYPYFGVPGRPLGLGAVAVDDALRAAAWLRTAVDLDGRGVGLIGASRGGEFAALVASHAPAGTFQAVVVQSPQARTVGSFAVDERGEMSFATAPDGSVLESWTVGGSPIPSDTPIEVERSDAPFLISEGEADEVWSPEGARELAARLDRAGRHPELVMLPGEGHNPGFPIKEWLGRRVEAFLDRNLAASDPAR